MLITCSNWQGAFSGILVQTLGELRRAFSSGHEIRSFKVWPDRSAHFGVFKGVLKFKKMAKGLKKEQEKSKDKQQSKQKEQEQKTKNGEKKSKVVNVASGPKYQKNYFQKVVHVNNKLKRLTSAF